MKILGKSNLNKTGRMEFIDVVNALQEAIDNDQNSRFTFNRNRNWSDFFWIEDNVGLIGQDLCHYELKKYNKSTSCAIEVHFEKAEQYHRFQNVISNVRNYGANNPARLSTYVVPKHEREYIRVGEIYPLNIIGPNGMLIDHPKLIEKLMKHLYDVDKAIGDDLRKIVKSIK